MKILVMYRPKSSIKPEDFMPLQGKQAGEVFKLMGEGAIREAYSFDGHTGGAYIMEADSVDAARETLQRLPFIERDMFDVSFEGLMPYRGFFAVAQAMG